MQNVKDGGHRPGSISEENDIQEDWCCRSWKYPTIIVPNSI